MTMVNSHKNSSSYAGILQCLCDLSNVFVFSLPLGKATCTQLSQGLSQISSKFAKAAHIITVYLTLKLQVLKRFSSLDAI